jgi:hypothetical protein
MLRNPSNQRADTPSQPERERRGWSMQRRSQWHSRGRRREVVDAEEDVVEADKDEALRQVCQIRERVRDEGTMVGKAVELWTSGTSRSRTRSTNGGGRTQNQSMISQKSREKPICDG